MSTLTKNTVSARTQSKMITHLRSLSSAPIDQAADQSLSAHPTQDDDQALSFSRPGISGADWPSNE